MKLKKKKKNIKKKIYGRLHGEHFKIPQVFLPFLTRSQINVLVARRVHYKDYLMIPKILQGLHLIQNLDTNYLLQKNKEKEKLKRKKRKRRKDFHTTTTPNELNTELS